MTTDDTELTRVDVVLEDRYCSVSDCAGRLLVYDRENDDAWVRSDLAVEVDDVR